MKKIIIFILCLASFTGNLWAQLNDSVLIDCYGAIRADMVRAVCDIVGYKNDSILQSISNSSLNEFRKQIKDKDTLTCILATAKPLNGTDVAVFHKNLRDTRRNFQYQLGTFFPEKEHEIENVFGKYINEIDKLTEECNTFNEDTTKDFELYLEKYPSGRFVGRVKSIREEALAQEVQAAKGNAEIEKSEKNKNNGRQWCIGTILAVILICIAIWKRKKFILFVRKQLKIMHNMETSEDEATKDQSEEQERWQYKRDDFPVETKSGDETTNIGAFTNDSSHKQENAGKETTVKEPVPLLPGPLPKKKPQAIDPKGKSTASDAGEWIVVGASVQGNGHIEMNLPCQDFHAYEYIKDGWGIAITSDGAGSARLSHVGSAASVARAMVHFKNLIEKERWIEKNILPSDNDWMKKSYQVLKTVRNELEALAKNNKCDIKDLSATIIVVIHSPIGILVVHVGDGRAGYKDMSGEWHSLVTPHKGEEANQTIFIPSDFWNHPFYEMSGVTVPESGVIREKVAAFTLMSDGCESTTWLCNQYNEVTGKYYDPNIPHSKFFNSCLDTLQTFRKNDTPLNERKAKWYQFIKDGNKKFEKETDDKTMILGTLYM